MMSMSTALFACALAAAAPAALQDTSLARSARDAPTLTVTGQGQVQARPDQATLRLGAVAEAEAASAAQQEVSRIMDEALDAIRDLDIEDDAIRTTGISLDPVYARPDPRDGRRDEPRIVGYRASNTIEVRIGDLEQIGPVIDAGVKAGANQIQQLSFELRDDIEQQQEALKRAVGDARAKAEAIAEALDVRLAGIRDVQEGGVSTSRPRMDYARMAMSEAASTPVQPGEIQIDGSVTITFRLTE